jgi:hypothetical protein
MNGIRDHEVQILSDHLGYFNRDNDQAVPATRNRIDKNSEFIHFGQRTRFGFKAITPFFAAGDIVRYALYQRSDEAFTRYITLGPAGVFYDSTSAISIGTIAGCTDFSAITLFDRVYITPIVSDSGMPGEFVYVYSGTGTFRRAAGLAPIGPTFAAGTGATGGHVTKGRHLISVAYETDSGFITQPGPVVFYNAPGKRKIDLTNIPIGPAGVIYRHILMTKFIKVYDGIPSHYELFFVPNGTILNNTATTLTIDAADSELTDSADYLLDLMPTIPAQLGFATYQGSLVGFAEDTKEAVARVSIVGSPESFNSVDGFIIVAPGDGGGVRNAREYRGSLELWKSNRTFATRTNADSPSTWSVIQIDGGYGTRTPRGITAVLDSSGAFKDTLLVCDDSGLLQFYGRYSDKPLTWQVDKEWRDHFSGSSNVAVDSINKRIYVTGTESVLMGDFNNGLDPDNIRWSVWTFQDESNIAIIPIQMSATAYQTVIHLTAKPTLFKYDTTLHRDNIGTFGGDPIDYAAAAIDNDVILPYIRDDQNFLLHCAGIRSSILGSGTLTVGFYQSGDVLSSSHNKTMSTSEKKDTLILANMIDERLSVRFRVNTIDNYVSQISDINLLIKPIWGSRPVVT